jgi:anti-anti-sigma factor
MSLIRKRFGRPDPVARLDRRRCRVGLAYAGAPPKRSLHEAASGPQPQLGVASMPTPQADVAPSHDELTILRRSEGDSEILILDGEIDLGSAPRLERSLVAAERSSARRVVLDLAELDFLDSTAIHLLIAAQQRAEANGHELVLTRVPAHAQRLVTLTGVTPWLTTE